MNCPRQLKMSGYSSAVEESPSDEIQKKGDMTIKAFLTFRHNYVINSSCILVKIVNHPSIDYHKVYPASELH